MYKYSSALGRNRAELCTWSRMSPERLWLKCMPTNNPPLPRNGRLVGGLLKKKRKKIKRGGRKYNKREPLVVFYMNAAGLKTNK